MRKISVAVDKHMGFDVPILVASALELLAQVLSEDGGQGAKSAGGLEITHDADDDHGRGLEDGNCIDDLALVHDGAGTVHAADDVGHPRLVGAESGKMGRRGGIRIAGEGADATGMVLRALLREEAEVAAAGGFELAVGHGGGCFMFGGAKSGRRHLPLT
jgi:hypothetical protein